MATKIVTDRFAHLTDAQRDAIRTTDCSLLVSAAAGSGKTTVLAERCAYLVCDLPADRRCGVGELLVVTFTDAAAGEMRSRIAAAIRKRITERPTDAYLREQLYLLDSASISTIHAFCRTIVQKWFPRAGVDPQATVLAGDEAELLRREVLDDLFRELYGRDDELGIEFQTLVDVYGAGEDGQIREVVLDVQNFINSLPDPYSWLDHAVLQVDPSHPGSVGSNVDALQTARFRDELSRHIEFAEYVAATIRRAWPVATSRVEAAETHLAQLHAWRERLSGSPGASEQVRREIRDHEFPRLKPRPKGLDDEDVAAFESATELYKRIKTLFCRRLQEGLCCFTPDEYREGLARVAPFVGTLTRLVRELDERYRDAKSAQAAMDFNDLQRGALRILAESDDADRPSAVARQLQQQYRHVLVDEFQDVDPLQASILRLVSRESADPPCGNLFTVGDIKQSIYRFRLAEPGLFTDRGDAFNRPGTLGRVIHLQENFRSRAGIIESVNAIFRRLMSGRFGGSEYDRHAELHAGAVYPGAGDAAVFETPAVELHLLEPVTRQTQAQDSDADESDEAGGTDDELDGIEREAFLIARRIREWMGLEGGARRCVAGRPETPGSPPSTRPLEFGDVVILLRALPHKAEPIADVLRRMGIPVRLEGADNQLDTTEFRDVYSLLQVLDNRQQDIPLAAVLRSPLLGDPLDEGDLLKIRLIDRTVPFYAAAGMYAIRGTDAGLRARLSTILARLDRYRERIQRECVSDVLWDLYEESDFLAFVSGLPDGVRRANHLVQLHELSRQFGKFSRQGLRRFLRFLSELVDQQRGGPPAGAAGAGENAVRIMTIHASKGLEFPVVILADLHKQFNLGDTRGMVLVDRKLGLALQVADPERRIRYPTLLHQLASESGRQESLSEELRVLYVALTRAREHLVLLGRCPLDRIQASRGLGGGSAPSGSGPSGGVLPRMLLESAGCVLDWLLPSLGRMPEGQVDWSGRDVDSVRAPFAVRVYERTETDGWRIPPAQRPETAQVLASVGELKPLPDDEPVDHMEVVDTLVASLGFEYPGLELTTLPARAAVSDFKQVWQPNQDPEERQAHRPTRTVARPAFLSDGPVALDSVARGTAVHRFLQLIDLNRPCTAEDLDAQRCEMVESGRLTPADGGAVDVESVAWFFTTDLGERVRRSAERVRREVAFVARVSPDRLDPAVRPRDPRDVVLVRGVVDLLLDEPFGLMILDYKTDEVSADECPARAEIYRPQLASYAEAVSTAYRRPVRGQYLVFLRARRLVALAESPPSSHS